MRKQVNAAQPATSTGVSLQLFRRCGGYRMNWTGNAGDQLLRRTRSVDAVAALSDTRQIVAEDRFGVDRHFECLNTVFRPVELTNLRESKGV